MFRQSGCGHLAEGCAQVFREFTEQKTDDGRFDHVPAWRDQLLANFAKTWRPTEVLIANATVVRHLAEHRLSRSK